MWKFLILALLVMGIGFIAMLFYKAHLSKTGQAAGLVANQLTPCPATPNCVCSEFKETKEHFIEPISLQGSSELVMAKLKRTIETMGASLLLKRPTI